MVAPPPGYYPPGYYPPPPATRPIGVAILAVLTIIGGVLIFLLGVLLVAAPLLLMGFGVPSVFGLALSLLGLIVVVFGMIWIGVGVGLWHLRSWAWWLAVIVMVLSILGSLAVPVAALLPALILIYLIVVRHHFH